MKHRSIYLILAAQAIALIVPQTAIAWEHHPLFTEPVLSTIPEISQAGNVTATTLEAFLSAVEDDLPAFLAAEEAWTRANMPDYAPRPDALAFQATGDAVDIRERFFKAIRINPTTKTPLYVSPLDENAATAKRWLDPSEVTILQDASNLTIFDFVEVLSGDQVKPLDVVAAACNEPDYGMDIGLFTDNGTEFGQYYGFGAQPFGNPGLDYGSQAPFHMGFYHESSLVFMFASFLKQSYPEHRIHLYKSLSEFAFSHDQDYWGWRFMGWGLHYMADLSMPYHTTALPGYSTFRMLLINLLDMIGWSTFKDNAVQISSNRHMAIETFEGNILVSATLAEDVQEPMLAAMLQDRTIPAYSDSFPREQVARVSHDLSGRLDKMIGCYMPKQFVSDPSVELADVPERDQIVTMVGEEHGAEAVKKLEQLTAESMTAFAVYGRSYAAAILNPSPATAKQPSASADQWNELGRFLRGMAEKFAALSAR